MTKAHLNHSFKEQDFKDKLNLPSELDDFKEVLIQAAKSGKYAPNNWLLPEGGKQDRSSQYNSISHHINQVLLGNKTDKDSGLDHRLHAACRLLMDYTRDKRGIEHPLDRAHRLLAEGFLEPAQVENFQDVPYIGDDGTEIYDTDFVKSGNEVSYIGYFIGDKKVTKEEYEDTVQNNASIYNDFNKGVGL